MMSVIKPLGAEVALTANTTVSNSQLVRIVNSNTTATFLLSVGNGTNSNTVYANLSIAPSMQVVVQKSSLDILFGNSSTALLAVPVAWKG